MTGLVNRGWTLPHPERLLTHTLQKAGYTTAMAGFQHVVADIDDGGFTRLLPQEAPDAQNRRPSRRLSGRRSSRPLLFGRGLWRDPPPETRFCAPAPRRESPPTRATCGPPAPFPDTPETRQDMAEYIDAARTLDAKMGRVLAALQDNGLADNTLVICTTDHGIAFPTMKCNLTDHGLGVMLVIRGPGGFSGGQVLDALVSQIDIYPTVCALAGIEVTRPRAGNLAPAAGKRPSAGNPRRNFRRSELPHLLRTPSAASAHRASSTSAASTSANTPSCPTATTA